ncbi:alcohol dehydrogenase-like 2 isoform X2 [Oryza glaberrima]|uniref:alcohol dehydrogenase-like 2 isoform X2 n=1 Tax=Oryza glaberrima TaxID=4538 RepID=UPI00224C46D0|nr:alcohol dehydrogenase-like 2 isoform X2 [Oryza glaberrima]
MQSGGEQGGRAAAGDGGGGGGAAAGARGSDQDHLHLALPHGHHLLAYGLHPSIFGHEAVGVVESVGEHVREVAVGDTVVPVFTAQCSECPDCLSDRSNICSKLPDVHGFMPRDGTTRFSSASTGEPIRHFLSVSSFVEYTVVDVSHVVKLDANFPPAMACLLSCGISTGVGAAWKVAAVEPGSSVAVFGLGAVGLAVAQGARMRGATRIIGVDLNPDKFDVGKWLGITDFINPNDTGGKTVSEVIKEMTGGGGADYCFECIGSASVMAEAFQSSRMGWGKTILLGVIGSMAPIGIPPQDLLPGRSVIGSLFGGIKPKNDIPMLAQKYLDKYISFVYAGAGAGGVHNARDGVRGDQQGVRAAHAGEEHPLHHLDERRQGDRQRRVIAASSSCR